jgi:flagellar hook-associated protein 2
MSMSVDGLVSGMDTTSLITQLLQAEAGPQTALKSRLSSTQLAASAYRTVNTTFAAVRAAAETALKRETWATTKGSSSAASIAVSSGTSAAPGQLSFTVDKVAAAHAVVRQDASWTTADADFGSTSLTVVGADGTTPKGTLTFAAGASLTEVAAAINGSTYNLSAAVVQVDDTSFALQVTSKKTGASDVFSLTGGGTFDVNTQGQDAKLTIGSVTKYSVYSSSNTFSSVLPGTTITVSRVEPTPVTVSVVADPDAVAAKVQSLVDAVNSALTNVKTYTSNATGSTAALKGDYSVSSLGGQLLDAVSFAVGTDGSAAKVGFQLTKDGKITFDKAKFLEALAADPTLAQRMVAGRAAGAGDNRVPGDADDVTAVTGIAGRVLEVAKTASDSATGSLVKLAEGQDSMAKDIQDRIDAWDLRLAKRKETLTRQFTAMETALSSLKNQSTWLAGQINSLPTSS